MYQSTATGGEARFPSTAAVNEQLDLIEREEWLSNEFVTGKHIKKINKKAGCKKRHLPMRESNPRRRSSSMRIRNVGHYTNRDAVNTKSTLSPLRRGGLCHVCFPEMPEFNVRQVPPAAWAPTYPRSVCQPLAGQPAIHVVRRYIHLAEPITSTADWRAWLVLIFN